MGTEISSSNHSLWDILLEEPFRIFFPIGVLGGFVGAFLWLAPDMNLALPYGGLYHGLLQIQGFVMAFAVGFLMTVLPRFMETDGSKVWEIGLSVVFLVGSMVALFLGDLEVAEFGFLALLIHLLIFALRRFVVRKDNPPAAFVLVGFGLLCGVAGVGLLLYPPPGFNRLGQNLLEQGMFLAFVMAVGSYLGPRLLYGVKGFPETEGPVFRKQLWMYTAVGILFLLSFVLEAGGAPVWGRLMRALIVSIQLLVEIRIYQRPHAGYWHLYLMWFSFWCVLLGLWLSGLFPVYEMTMLHITFVGGFGLLTILIGSRVITGHCDVKDLWLQSAWQLSLPGLLILLAGVARLGAGAYPETYAVFLYCGVGLWLFAMLLWGMLFVPRAHPRHVAPED
ncbi:MAG: hypothetical protein ACI8V2_001975 [Candidatus Latescibacterota bacterium]